MGREIQRTFAGFEAETAPENLEKTANSEPIGTPPGQQASTVSRPQVRELADLEGKTVYVVEQNM